MWSYYGSKTNIAKLYPPPRFDTIIEPFAGSAKYSLAHFEKEIILVDKYDVIINIWKWLQQCSERDILSLPRKFNFGDRLSDLGFDCKEAQDFMGFIAGCGAARPVDKIPKRKTTDRPNHINYNIQRVAKNLFKIKHWRFYNCDYKEIENREAVWFIDPPY